MTSLPVIRRLLCLRRLHSRSTVQERTCQPQQSKPTPPRLPPPALPFGAPLPTTNTRLATQSPGNYGVVQGSAARRSSGGARAGARLHRPGRHVEQQVELDLHGACMLPIRYDIFWPRLIMCARRASTTPSTTTSPSRNTRESAIPSPPTATLRNHTTALSQTVRPTQAYAVC